MPFLAQMSRLGKLEPQHLAAWHDTQAVALYKSDLPLGPSHSDTIVIFLVVLMTSTLAL